MATPVPAGTANLLEAPGNVLLCTSRGDLAAWPPAPHSLCSAAPMLLSWSVMDAPNIGFMHWMSLAMSSVLEA